MSVPTASVVFVYAIAARAQVQSVQVFGRRHDESMGALKRPATEKRQGTKSRWGMCGGAASTMGIWSRRLDQ